MRKIIFCITIFFAQGLAAQITLTPFTPDIAFTQFAHSIDVYANEIVAFSSYSHDLTQSRVVVFERNGGILSQETYFTPSDAALNDNFGGSVSINNDFIAASSKFNDQVAVNAGAVYMYRKVAANWVFFQKIVAFDGAAGDNFGENVKVLGNQLFVSAVNDEEAGLPTNSGAVYVYNFNGTGWVFSQKLSMPGTHLFGSKIKISNNKLAISSEIAICIYDFDGTNWNLWHFGGFSPLTDFDLDNNQLFVLMDSIMYIYNLDTTTWYLTTGLTDLNYLDKYPTNFIVKNDLMFISLNFHSLLYTAKTPTAVYRKIGGHWTFLEYIYGNGPLNQDDSFGTKIAISDDVVVIAAPNEYLPSSDGGRGYITDVALGVNENNLANSNVYPNPTTGELFLSENMLNNLNAVEIYQIDGKLVSKMQPSQNLISLNNFQSGLYLLKFIYNNNTYLTKKVIKN